MYRIFYMLVICCSVFILELNIVRWHRKLDRRKTFDKIWLKKNMIRASIRDICFFIIAFIIYLFFYIVIISFIIMNEKNLLKGNFYESGMATNFLIICYGNLVCFVFKLIQTMINKLFKKRVLSNVNENSKMWAFIMVSLYFTIVGFLGEKKHMIQFGYMELLIVFGRIFWIDTDLKKLVTFFKSFFALPYLVTYFYSGVLITVIIAPWLKFIEIRFASMSAGVGLLFWGVITQYQYKDEFKNLTRKLRIKIDNKNQNL